VQETPDSNNSPALACYVLNTCKYQNRSVKGSHSSQNQASNLAQVTRLVDMHVTHPLLQNEKVGRHDEHSNENS